MKKKIFGILAIIVVIAALLGVYYFFGEKPEKNNVGPGANASAEFVGKNVTIEVIDENGQSAKYSVTTHSDYLEGVMREAEGLEFELEDGMVMSVNDKRADYVLDSAYWAFYVGETYCNYGISDQPVNDGDHFRIVYTKA